MVVDESERRTRAIRCARELAHAATSLASEAASLARTFEAQGALEVSIAASHASIRAAQSAFELDETARSAAPDLGDALRCALRSLEAAESAVSAARQALTAAGVNGTHSSSGVGAG